jgi:hypothetical protein
VVSYFPGWSKAFTLCDDGFQRCTYTVHLSSDNLKWLMPDPFNINNQSRSRNTITYRDDLSLSTVPRRSHGSGAAEWEAYLFTKGSSTYRNSICMSRMTLRVRYENLRCRLPDEDIIAGWFPYVFRHVLRHLPLLGPCADGDIDQTTYSLKVGRPNHHQK